MAIPSQSLDTQFSPTKALISQYQNLIAIDTNTQMIDGRRISATIAYIVPRTLSSYEKAIPFVPLCGYIILDVIQEVNPEKIGWHLILTRHINSNHFQAGRRLGVVVDTELGSHGEMNARKTAYYESHMLPSYASLIYASDASGDELPNHMIRHCDSAASLTLKRLSYPHRQQLDAKNGDKNFSGFLSINFQSSAARVCTDG